MSRDNVGVVKAMFEAWNAHAWDAYRQQHSQDVIIRRFIEGWPEPGPVVGLDAVMKVFREMRPWEEDIVEVIGDFIEAGSTVAVRIRWRGSSQGQDLGMELTPVYTLRDGKIALIEYFRDHAEALEAVGLSE